jgi:hypothetical protein
MKDLKLFPTLAEYRNYIHTEIIKTDVFKNHPFYRGLIDFVIDHRSPIFFKGTKEHEYAHFTQYFNFVLMRDNYPNDFIRDMFFMHDFVHMVFDNPLNPKDYSFDYFCEIVNYNEYVASNDTEILTYYRIPEFREKSLPYKILYDLLIEKYKTAPSVETLLNIRKAIVFDETDGGLGSTDVSEKIFSFLRKFKENNKVWCELWYNGFPKIPAPYAHKRTCLSLKDYVQVLENYMPEHNEERYRFNILTNVQTALSLTGERDLPQSFDECAEAIKRLENKVIMENVAEAFHTQYMKNKNK